MTRSSTTKAAGPPVAKSAYGEARRSNSPDTQALKMVDVDVDKLTSPLAGTNPLGADEISADERIAEIGEILAVGIGRALMSKARDNSTGQRRHEERSCFHGRSDAE
jgi:hypothetical protein